MSSKPCMSPIIADRFGPEIVSRFGLHSIVVPTVLSSASRTQEVLVVQPPQQIAHSSRLDSTFDAAPLSPALIQRPSRSHILPLFPLTSLPFDSYYSSHTMSVNSDQPQNGQPLLHTSPEPIHTVIDYTTKVNNSPHSVAHLDTPADTFITRSASWFKTLLVVVVNLGFLFSFFLILDMLFRHLPLKRILRTTLRLWCLITSFWNISCSLPKRAVGCLQSWTIRMDLLLPS